MHALEFRIVLNVRFFDLSVCFYRDILGMASLGGWSGPHSRGARFSVGGGPVIEIVGAPEGAPPFERPTFDSLMFGLRVPDVDALYAQLMAVNVPIVRPPEDAPGGRRSFAVEDPNGIRIWFYQGMETA